MYVAVMVCVTEVSILVVNFAAPPLRAIVFRIVAPSLKVTLPVGVPLNCGATLAVKVTDCPTFDGFCEEANAVVLVALLTTWLTAFDVLPGRLESPPYTALITGVPTFSAEVVKVAEPLLKVPVPSPLSLS